MSNKKDFATSTVLTAPSTPTAGTSLVVQPGHGARFPAAPFYVTVHPPSEFPTLDNAEKLLVSAKSTDTFTITRAQGDTTAKSIEAGWRISNALFLDDIPSGDVVGAAGSTSGNIATFGDTTGKLIQDGGKALPSGDIVGVSDSQTLTNKTLSTGSVIGANVTVTEVLKKVYPVGSIYIATVSTNPNTLFGFGTWSAYGAGRVIVGKAASGTFATAGATGGTETHTHPLSDSGQAKVEISGGAVLTNPISTPSWDSPARVTGTAGAAAPGRTLGVGLAGNTDSATTLQPYIVAYMWERTA